ncbi:uncharacterized protein JCM6883_002659 [Sporobolomyces salmoneus]|uniref:uncharacterized protein n=1 Tax=Sporobolomyces salmoneus TaxID=183962 RepID=UPI003174D22C
MAIPTSFNFHTTSTKAASHYNDQISGKTVLVTGVSPNGLGAEAATAIARSQPKLLILAGRSAEKIKQTQEEIKKIAPEVETKVLILDLASFKAAKKAGEEVLSWNIPIDVLINNAGVMAYSEKTLTEDGYEIQFASNHLGPFIFTNTILPALHRSSAPRIVSVSSWGHHLSDVYYDDPKAEQSYDKWKRYGSSKTANVLFAVALSKRGISAVSLHPGAIRTELLRHLTKEDEIAMGFINEDGTPGTKWEFKKMEEGASTHIVAAFEPWLKGGEYLDDCQIQPEHEEYAVNPDKAEKLWKLSNEWTGEQFE